MSLTLANPSSETLVPTVPSVATQTVTTVPTGASAPVAGDTNNQNLPASGTVLIVVGVILGIIGVASVILLIWWMRRRAMARLQAQQLPLSTGRSRPPPPPKSGSSKALPQLNVSSANAYRPGGAPFRVARSGTNDSLNTDKALPGKPIESVWNSPAERHNKSPALTSANELKGSPNYKSDEEMAMQRMRSESVGSYKQPTLPTNFI